MSLVWQSVAAKRLAEPPARAQPPPSEDGGCGTLFATGRAVLALDAVPGEDGAADAPRAVTLDSKLKVPKLKLSMAAPARGKSFLKTAFKVRQKKRTPLPKK